MKKVLFTALFVLFAQNVYSQDLLLAGDSWAMFMCLDGSFGQTFSKHNVDSQVVGCEGRGATRFGGRAVEFLSYKQAKYMDRDLKNNKNIKVVYLSIGGNDFLGNWTKFLTIDQERALALDVRDAILKIADHIHAIRPEAKVLVSGYDYGNFKEYSKIIKAYSKLYQNMGSPEAGELHRAILRFSNVIATVANQKDIFYIHHYGLAHYYYGSKENNLAPRQTAPPDQISPASNPILYGGVPDYEVPSASLLHLLFLKDAYHPNAREFRNIAEHAYQIYLKDWLK